MSTDDVLLALLALAVVVSLFSRGGRRDDAAQRLQVRRIEQKVDLLLTQAGLSLGDRHGPEVPGLPRVQQHLARGEKIAAIKAYREATGVGLAEAKEAVERMARGLHP